MNKILKIEIKEVNGDWIWLGKLTVDGLAELLKTADAQNDLVPTVPPQEVEE